MQPCLCVWVDGRQSGARLHFIYHFCVAVNLRHCLSMTISLLVGLHLLFALLLCCCMCFRLINHGDTLWFLYTIPFCEQAVTLSSGICWTESVERVNSLLICVMAGVMCPSSWWCHGDKHTVFFSTGCLEMPLILWIDHFCVISSTIDLPTWNLAYDQKNCLKIRWRWKCFISRLLNIPCLLNRHISRQVIERPGLL